MSRKRNKHSVREGRFKKVGHKSTRSGNRMIRLLGEKLRENGERLHRKYAEKVRPR